MGEKGSSTSGCAAIADCPIWLKNIEIILVHHPSSITVHHQHHHQHQPEFPRQKSPLAELFQEKIHRASELSLAYQSNYQLVRTTNRATAVL